MSDIAVKVLRTVRIAVKGNVYGREIAKGSIEHVSDELVSGLEAEGYITTDLDGEEVLRQDGPTIGEFVAAGYSASMYPPKGFASKSLPEEIQAAIDAEDADEGKEKQADDNKAVDAVRAELAKLTVSQLREKAVEMSVAVADDAKKDDLLDALVAAAVALQS